MTYEDANIISSTDLPSVAYLWLVCHFGHIPQTSIHVCGICSNSLTDVTNTQQGGYLKTQTHTHTHHPGMTIYVKVCLTTIINVMAILLIIYLHSMLVGMW